MPEVLVTSLYNGQIRRTLGIYWKKTTNFNNFFVFRDSDPPIFGAINKITTWKITKELRDKN